MNLLNTRVVGNPIGIVHKLKLTKTTEAAKAIETINGFDKNQSIG